MKRFLFLPLLLLLCFLPSTAPAPLYGAFESLNALINDAEFIVLARILKRPDELEMDTGGGGIFEIEVGKVLKGDAKEKQHAKAYLRDVEFQIRGHDSASLTNGFIPGQLYLLFLNKPGTHTRDENGKPLPVDFENENCEGDAVWISPLSWHLDLDPLKAKTPREAVVALLTHTATDHQRFVAAVGAILESRAVSPLFQRVTQTIWFEKNAEDAAKFYVAIFKEGTMGPTSSDYYEIGPDGDSKFRGFKMRVQGQEILLLDGGSKMAPEQPPMLTVTCWTQDEIDYYWDKLSAGGEKLRAGWVKDKFGVLWQIVPLDLQMLLGGKYPVSTQKVEDDLRKMNKIDVGALMPHPSPR